MIPGLGRFPGGVHSNPLPYSFLENPHGQKRSLEGYSPWDHKELDTTEGLRTNLVMCTQFYFALFFKLTFSREIYSFSREIYSLLFCPYTYVGFSGGTVQFSSVSQLCPTLCNPMDCSMPGFPVLHHLLKLAQTQVH